MSVIALVFNILERYKARVRKSGNWIIKFHLIKFSPPHQQNKIVFRLTAHIYYLREMNGPCILSLLKAKSSYYQPHPRLFRFL
jgi:hypothetical protein